VRRDGRQVRQQPLHVRTAFGRKGGLDPVSERQFEGRQQVAIIAKPDRCPLDPPPGQVGLDAAVSALGTCAGAVGLSSVRMSSVSVRIRMWASITVR